MHIFASFQRGKGTFELTPALIALLASQLEKLVLEPHQEEIVRQLLQGKSVSEVAAITGESEEVVLWSAICAISQANGRPPPPAPQTVRSPRRPPLRPSSAAAELVFSPEESLNAVASAQQLEARAATEDAVFGA